MDVVLDVLDTFVFDRLYAAILPRKTNHPVETHLLRGCNRHVNRYVNLEPSLHAFESSWYRDHVIRQFLSLFLVTWAFGLILYISSATLSYKIIFDKRAMQHPKFLRNQIQLEISQAMRAMPVMALLTAPFFLAEVREYTKLYDLSSEGPFGLYTYLQYPLFIAFTDCAIYWIHRGLHHPLIYKHLHKPHHQWIISTPYASFAFHPVDGWCQSLPYHIYPFLFPLQKSAYLGLFIGVSIWTIMIHDGEYVTNSSVINGSACHTIHHYYFNYNYGQFTTLWDRIGGSYRKPNIELFDREARLKAREIQRQVIEMERLVRQVEGVDGRCYKENRKKSS